METVKRQDMAGRGLLPAAAAGRRKWFEVTRLQVCDGSIVDRVVHCSGVLRNRSAEDGPAADGLTVEHEKNSRTLQSNLNRLAAALEKLSGQA